MIAEFKLKGLNNKSNPEHIYATCEFIDKEDWFHAKIKGTAEQKLAMWNYCEGDWGSEKIAEIEFEGYSTGGMPINPVILNFKHKDS